MNWPDITSSQGIEYVRFKWVLRAIESGRRETTDIDAGDDIVLSVGGEHVGWRGEWILESPRHISRGFYNDMSTGIIKQNDILLVKDGATIGKTAIAERIPHDEAAVNEHVFLLRVSDVNCPKYYFYVMQSPLIQDQLWLEVRGAAQPGLSSASCGKLIVPRPRRPVQKAIAAYLNRETARLDTLLAEKERLLDLLAEKRRSLIARAVTCGLDPNVPLRDSGIPWLGEIPAHWTLIHLKRLLASMDYGISVSVETMGNVAVLRMGDIRDGEIDYSRIGFVDEVDGSLLLQSGDLVFNRTNSLDQIGKVALFRGKPEYPVSFASYLVRFRCNPAILPEFLNWLLNSAYPLAWGRAQALPAIGQANLNPNRYGYLPISLPPIEEQKEIVHYISSWTSRIDAVRTETRLTIKLLGQRRSALISAATTGQLRGNMTP